MNSTNIWSNSGWKCVRTWHWMILGLLLLLFFLFLFSFEEWTCAQFIQWIIDTRHTGSLSKRFLNRRITYSDSVCCGCCCCCQNNLTCFERPIQMMRVIHTNDARGNFEVLICVYLKRAAWPAGKAKWVIVAFPYRCDWLDEIEISFQTCLSPFCMHVNLFRCRNKKKTT